MAERHLAHPLKVKLMAEARIKTDKLDSLVLAQWRRTGFLPESYLRPMAPQRDLEVRRQRLVFGRQQLAVTNRIHGLVDRHLSVRETAMRFGDLFGRQGLEWLRRLAWPEPDQSLLDELRQELALRQQLMAQSDARIAAMRQRDGPIQVIDELPGIGPFFAALILTQMGDITRFGSAKKLGRSAGLVPPTYQSADRVPHGRLTKPGNPYRRWAAIEIVHHLGPSTPWGQIRHRLKQTKSSHTAKAATARRLLTQIYYRLKAYETETVKG